MFSAAYAGRRWPGTDVENLLFNNIDQTLLLFRSVGTKGVRFQDLGLDPPPDPSGRVRAAYWRYELTDAATAFHGVRLGPVACEIAMTDLRALSARLAARIWLAVRIARPRDYTPVLAPHGYALRAQVRGLDPGTTIKAIVDGASAALQGVSRPDLHDEATTRLARLLEADRAEIRSLIDSAGAPLGPAEQLFVLDGTDQVRITPDDHRCLAAEVLAGPDGGSSQLAIDLYPAFAE